MKKRILPKWCERKSTVQVLTQNPTAAIVMIADGKKSIAKTTVLFLDIHKNAVAHENNLMLLSVLENTLLLIGSATQYITKHVNNSCKHFRKHQYPLMMKLGSLYRRR